MSTVSFQQYLSKAISYPAYRDLIDELLANNKTTGDGHPAAYVGYTRLNVQRMERLDKTVALTDDLVNVLKGLKRKYIWLVITEGWCGDAAQNLPIINLIAKQSPNIELKLILRDENLELMDRYLTLGGRSIPKLIVLDAETLQELGNWGPRPAATLDMLKAYKANPNKTHDEFAKEVHTWYAKDKALSIQHELLGMLQEWERVGTPTNNKYTMPL
ncbi:thioredoxin family protein [soil metagenome]